jgi:hypothetical protein
MMTRLSAGLEKGIPMAQRWGPRTTCLGIISIFLCIGLAAAWLCPPPTAAGAAPQSAFDPQKNFTITKIEPDAAKESVRLFFSQPVPLEVLQSSLRFLPRVKLDWSRAKMSPEGVLTLQGEFKYGAGHFVTLKDGAVAQNRTYVPTVTTFVMPNRPATVEFVGPQRVIERDSRQLLHVRVANVDAVQVGALRVPPLLLPQALAAQQARTDLKQAAQELRTAADQLKPLIQGKSAYAPFEGAPLEENQLFPAGGKKTGCWRCLCRLASGRTRKRGPSSSSGCGTTRKAAGPRRAPGCSASPTWG